MTKHGRNNHKTIRISDEALNYIESFQGDTFNDKVNNMIDYFISMKQHYEVDLRNCENEIVAKKVLLRKLNDRISKLRIMCISCNSDLFDIFKEFFNENI